MRPSFQRSLACIMNPSNGVTSPTRSTGWGGEGRRIGEEKGGGEGGGEKKEEIGVVDGKK